MNIKITTPLWDQILSRSGRPSKKLFEKVVLSRLARCEKILNKINTPEFKDFLSSVESEAKHQRLRWPSEHDVGKADADWFWLIGHLAGKAVHAQTEEKRLHHIVTAAAACLNWHSSRIGAYNDMRPGINPKEGSTNDKTI